MESHHAADPRPLQELVVELERELRGRLSGARLVMEAGLDDATFERVEGAVRRLARAANGEAWLTRRLPAVLLVHLVGCGSRLASGSFWPTATFDGKLDQQELGPAFERSIRELGLETFPALVDERALRFVAPILAHGGIPRYAAGRFIDILVSTLTRHGMSTAGEVVAFWRSRRTALEFGHRPIRRFLLYGGEPALDYLDRAIELARLDADAARATAAADLQLPDHIVEAYLEHLGRTGSVHAASRGGPSLPRPRVALDPFDPAGPYLELPTIALALGRGTWTVDDGTTVATRRTSAFDAPRLLLAPSLTWSAELRMDDGTVRTSTFEALGQSPYVVFDPRTGGFVDDLRPVALEECWLLAPREASVSGEDPSGRGVGLQILSTLPDPGGRWTGYSVRHLSLDGVSAVKVTVPRVVGDAPEDLIRVATASRPRLVGDPVRGLTTADGAPVYPAAPRLVVPRLGGFDEGRWLVTLGSAAGRRSEPLTALGHAGQELSLGPMLPAGALCVVDLTVRGRLGSDLRTRFAVVLGAEAEVPAAVLLPGDEVGRWLAVRSNRSIELSQGTAAGTPGVVRVPIPPSGDRVSIRASTGGEGLELALRFPRLQWAVRRAGSLPELGTNRVQVDADDLVEGSVESLLVSTLLEGRHVRAVLENGGAVIQELPAGRTAPPEGRWAIPLAALRDTVRLAPSPRLMLVVEIDDRRVPVAAIAATAKAAEIRAELIEGPEGRQVRVSFTEARRLAGVVVRLWSKERPWEAPVVAPVPDGGAAEVTFPVGGVAVGRYRAEVAVDDPWFSPRRPPAGAASCAEIEVGDPNELRQADASLEHSGDRRDLVSLAIITGMLPREFGPADVAETWTELVATARALMADAASDPRSDRSLQAIVRLLALDPRRLYEQLSMGDDHAGFDPAELLRLFLMARRFLGRSDLPMMSDRVLRPLWRSCPPFAALADIPAARTGDAEAAARCDEHLGWRPDAAPPPVGRRPELAELSLAPSRQAALRDMLALVPTALLTWDAYQVACFEWLAVCSLDVQWARAWAARAAGALDGMSFGQGFDAYVEARRGIKHPDFAWADALRASLACAAHVVVDDGLAGFAGDMLEELSASCRLLVTHDLVLSMALIGPDDAAAIRASVPQGREPEPGPRDGQWQALLDAAGDGEPQPARVDHVDAAGAVIVDVDGFKGRVKPHERGWTAAERARARAPGEEIAVVILGADSVHRRLELSMRRALPSPWLDPGRRPAVGDVVEVSVIAAKPFGVFAATEWGLDGLIHVSSLPDDDLPESGDERAAILEARYPTGSTLHVKVMDLDAMTERMSLSVIDAFE